GFHSVLAFHARSLRTQHLTLSCSCCSCVGSCSLRTAAKPTLLLFPGNGQFGSWLLRTTLSLTISTWESLNGPRSDPSIRPLLDPNRTQVFHRKLVGL